MMTLKLLQADDKIDLDREETRNATKNIIGTSSVPQRFVTQESIFLYVNHFSLGLKKA